MDLQACVTSGDFRRESVSWSSPASRSCSDSLAPGPIPASSKSAAYLLPSLISCFSLVRTLWLRCCSCSAAQSCPALWDPMDCSTPGLPVLRCLLAFAQIHVPWVGDDIQHLILCRCILLLPSIFPSMRVFSNESAVRIRWPKYWSFSFSISYSKEYSGLISFKSDWFALPAVQGILRSLLQHHSLKVSILRCFAFSAVQFSYLLNLDR